MFRKGGIKDPQLFLVCNSATVWEAEQVKGLLEKEGIPALIMDREDSGDYLRVLGFGSPFGVDVYVNSRYAERAGQLVDEMLSENEAITEDELADLAMSMAPEEEP